MAMAPLPFSPVGFSGEIIRDSAPGVRFGNSPKPGDHPEFWAVRVAEKMMLRASAARQTNGGCISPSMRRCAQAGHENELFCTIFQLLRQNAANVVVLHQGLKLRAKCAVGDNYIDLIQSGHTDHHFAAEFRAVGDDKNFS